MELTELQSIKQRFGIIGNSPLLHRGIEVAVQVAPTDLSVLITGESGVGKENFPKIIHAYSLRRHKKDAYVAINCGAIPKGTIESELFGHKRGAFTDAYTERKGYFEMADGGTLFLDEVGELPLETQAQLLRVLETGEFIRVGESQVRKVDVRVIAATNLDMRAAISEGRFREDLYYRLNTVEIKVPALRERVEDIPLLFRKFVVDFCQRYKTPTIQLTEDATQMLKAYYWNGNVRQLKHTAEQICVTEPTRTITAEILQRHLPAHEMNRTLALLHPQAQEQNYMNERELLYKVLFDMKKEMTEMRQQLNGLLTNSTTTQHLTDIIGTAPTVAPPAYPKEYKPMPDREEVVDAEEVTGENPVPTNSEPVEQPNWSDIERESIRKALERHQGSRRLAAEELKLSERTLYRKIKIYDL